MKYTTLTEEDVRQARIGIVHELEAEHVRTAIRAEPAPPGSPARAHAAQRLAELEAEVGYHLALLLPERQLDGGAPATETDSPPPDGAAIPTDGTPERQDDPGQ